MCCGMVTFSEINELRKSGCLGAAYELAETALVQSSDDLWLRRAMGWVLNDYMGANASYSSIDSFVVWLERFVSYRFDFQETVLFNCVAWNLRKLLVDIAKHTVDDERMCHLFRVFSSLTFPVNEDSYSALLQAGLALNGKWSMFPDFVRWWNLDNLRPSDFLPFKLDNGREVMSLAERVYVAYSRCLLSSGRKEMLTEFAPKLENLVKDRPSMLYPVYYLAKFYIALERLDDAVAVLKPFVKSKNRDFWVWQLMAEAQTSDDARLSFTCKALSCGGKEEMLVSLREMAAGLFSRKGFYREARYEVERAVSVREGQGWRISANLETMRHSDWYRLCETSTDNTMFYKQHCDIADGYIYGERKKVLIVIVSLNKEKGYAGFVTENREMGFFKIPKIGLRLYDVVEITCCEITKDAPTRIQGIEVKDGSLGNFFSDFNGVLHTNERGFGMVGSVYVNGGLMADIPDGSVVTGRSVVSFDKKKGKWGRRAVELRVA